MSEPASIDGFGITHYRSFGDVPQRIGPLARVNFIVGQNNSGKSNVLRFLADHYRRLAEPIRSGKASSEALFSDLDQHISGNRDPNVQFWVAADTQSDSFAQWSGKLQRKLGNRFQLAERVLTSETLRQGSELVWFRYAGPRESLGVDPAMRQALTDEEPLNDRQWEVLWQ